MENLSETINNQQNNTKSWHNDGQIRQHNKMSLYTTDSVHLDNFDINFGTQILDVIFHIEGNNRKQQLMITTTIMPKAKAMQQQNDGSSRSF